MSSGEIRSKQMFGFLWLSLVATINTIPLAFVSFLANISSVRNCFLQLSRPEAKNRFIVVVCDQTSG
jgi:hypothetical protein